RLEHCGWLIVYFFFGYINRLHTSQNTIRTYRKRRKLLGKKALRELDEDTGLLFTKNHTCCYL
ncbi:MAG: hypothetical protein M3227_03355, partial [Thermoproteota archaeon]|nr:hypothetical protein [Thermoproteota archaeon]